MKQLENIIRRRLHGRRIFRRPRSSSMNVLASPTNSLPDSVSALDALNRSSESTQDQRSLPGLRLATLPSSRRASTLNNSLCRLPSPQIRSQIPNNSGCEISRKPPPQTPTHLTATSASGAALLLTDGSIVTGCNVENASYRLTSCAEQAAIARAVAERGPDIRLRAVAVANLNDAAVDALRRLPPDTQRVR